MYRHLQTANSTSSYERTSTSRQVQALLVEPYGEYSYICTEYSCTAVQLCTGTSQHFSMQAAGEAAAGARRHSLVLTFADALLKPPACCGLGHSCTALCPCLLDAPLCAYLCSICRSNAAPASATDAAKHRPVRPQPSPSSPLRHTGPPTTRQRMMIIPYTNTHVRLLT